MSFPSSTPLGVLVRLLILAPALLLVCFDDVVRADDCRYAPNGGFAQEIHVDVKGGRGKFNKVQEAINSIKPPNTEWVAVYVGPGTFNEQVNITVDRPCIFLQGSGIRQTEIAFPGHDMTDTSATLKSQADNVVVKDITIKNSYNVKPGPIDRKHRPIKQAVAAEVTGDKSSFHRVGFYSFQDTLWDAKGRHFFNDCTIEGAVDFIWGKGQSIYQNCALSIIGYGYLTAQGKDLPDEASGFVFKECTVKKDAKITEPIYLGRAYGAYSTVIFDNSYFENIIKPEGWDAWDYVGHEGNLTYTEANCHGPGNGTSGRVKWEKKLPIPELRKYTEMTFIDNEGWLKKQPQG